MSKGDYHEGLSEGIRIGREEAGKRIAELEKEIENTIIDIRSVLDSKNNIAKSFLPTTVARLLGVISEGGGDFRTASEMKAENGWTGDADECPSCKGSFRDFREVTDATLGMNYDCSDDWHTDEGGADEKRSKK